MPYIKKALRSSGHKHNAYRLKQCHSDLNECLREMQKWYDRECFSDPGRTPLREGEVIGNKTS